jgi:hypothetical protein
MVEVEVKVEVGGKVEVEVLALHHLEKKSFRCRGTSHMPYFFSDPLCLVPLLILRPHKPGK